MNTNYMDGFVNGVAVTSPTKSPGGAVFCPYGSFVPVSPQALLASDGAPGS